MRRVIYGDKETVTGGVKMKKYNTLLRLLLYLLPIIRNGLTLPLCGYYEDWKIFLVQMVTNAIITPIYMVFAVSMIIKKFNIGVLILSLLVILVGIMVLYISWGITTGYILKPDSETILLLKYQILISFAIFIVGYFIKRKNC